MKSIKKTICVVLIFGSCLKPAFAEKCEDGCKSKKTQVINLSDSKNIEKNQSYNFEKKGWQEHLAFHICCWCLEKVVEGVYHYCKGRTK